MRTREIPKTIIIVGDFPPLISGIGDYSACLGRALVAKGTEVAIATTKMAGVPESEHADGMEIHRIVQGWNFSDVQKINSLLSKFDGGTVVNIQYPCPTTYGRRLMINLLPALIRWANPSLKVVVTMHGIHEHSSRWRARVIPMILAAHALILVTNKDIEMLLKWMPPVKSKLNLIPVASNIPVVPLSEAQKMEIRSNLGFAQDDVVMAFFGGIRQDKGFLEVLETARVIRANNRKLRLLIIGGFVYPAEVKTKYARNASGILAQDDFSSFVSVARAPEPEDVSHFLQISDLAVFPFIKGAAENRTSLLAALIHGLPVVTTRGPSTPENFESDYGVETVPVGDHKLLIEKVTRLINHPEVRKELGSRTSAISANIAWTPIAHETMALYKCLTRIKRD